MEKMEKISPDVLKKVEDILKDISLEKNLVEIPDSNGLKIVRMNSKEFRERNNDVTVLFFEIPDNDYFFITTK
jgi:hypothetical protein